ncbi:hypothetical protein [Bacillus mycoides]|uniref:hypothetical protein n=1 Tax=Bacillus mycoides TaxID=1405 RepID=UPI000994270E|nr:hypothetical protein [Bacillus mycoides]OOR15765.1 hypothetical protein BW891_24505 [Bacillus mycoides]
MLMEFTPLEFRTVEFESSQLKEFQNKKYMKDLLIETTIINEGGEFQIPTSDERNLSIPMFKNSEQRRVLPFGFRVVENDIEYTPRGRAIVTITASITFKKTGDGRHPEKNVITDHKVYFVFIEKTQKWLLVDLANENHQNTVTFYEREKEEAELVDQFQQDYFAYFNQFAKVMNADLPFNSVTNLKKYFELFAGYKEVAFKGFDSYRFFNSLSPIEYKYLVRFIDDLWGSRCKVFGHFKKFKNDLEEDLMYDEEQIFKDIKGVADKIKKFFRPRDEKKPDKLSQRGYCPTFEYLDELDRVVIPNAAEIERRNAYNSPKIHWSLDKEKEFISKYISYWFKKDSEEEEPVEEEEIVDGILGQKYNIKVKQLESWKMKKYQDVKFEFYELSQNLGVPPSEYLNDAKLIKTL